ncbi:MAG: FG-GAP-like repeat-containing protein [Candidatus Electryonea clarkiae]|nr:FG-GAP-like repeat-containing protein [Candidatus Electryonea clarkiae]MDP8288210.1 FG-GAP-like repeat-containing protein [Candidatus Electryonea clarkiae]
MYRNKLINMLMFVSLLPTLVFAQGWSQQTIDNEFSSGSSVSTSDVDGDGDQDLVGGTDFEYNIFWWENIGGEGQNWERHTIDEGNASASVFVADMDGDGDTDVISEDESGGGRSAISWWENVEGDGLTWTEHEFDDLFGSTNIQVVSDVDSNGDIDFIGSRRNGLVWWENEDGDGLTWTEHSIAENINGFVSVTDVEDDGDNDVLVSVVTRTQFGDSSGVKWLENVEGDGLTWSEHTLADAEVGFGRQSSQGTDIDGDGDVDILALNSTTLRWWENVNGGGQDWEEHQINIDFEDVMRITANDIDSDGDTDLIGLKVIDRVGYITGIIVWWENVDGTGENWSEHSIEGDYIPDAIVANDIDNDGFPDIIALLEEGLVWWKQIPFITLEEISLETVSPSFVNLIFRATDQAGKGVTNLGDLSLYEIMEDDSPISTTESIPAIGQVSTLPFNQKTVLMLDNSFSIGLNLDFVKDAAIVAVQEKFPEQEIAIWTFSEDVEEVQSFTTNTTQLINAINGITLGPPSTNLYGAVVAGVAEWEDSFGADDGIELGAMVLMTDGEDTQGSVSVEDALNAVENKSVLTVAVGEGADTDILRQLGTTGFYEATDFESLPEVFAEIQHDIEVYANSFYWFVYVSPTRGDIEHTLHLSILDNPLHGDGSYLEVTFNSNGFSSVYPGVYLNRDFNALLGIEEYTFEGSNYQTTFDAETLFGLRNPIYTWSVEDPDLIELQVNGAMNESAHVILLTEEPFSTTLTVSDSENEHIKTIDLVSTGVGVEDEFSNLPPLEYALHAAYPNPFNPTTIATVSLPQRANLTVGVMNILGREVVRLAEGKFSAGNHSFRFDATGMASGTYFIYAVVPGQLKAIKRIVLIK